MIENKQNGEKFVISFHQDWMKQGSTIAVGLSGNIKARVLEDPKVYYGAWYWKILNYLTFKQCFNKYYTYICRIEK